MTMVKHWKTDCGPATSIKFSLCVNIINNSVENEYNATKILV